MLVLTREVFQTIGPYLAGVPSLPSMSSLTQVGGGLAFRGVFDLRQIALHQIPGRESPVIYLCAGTSD